MDRRKREIPGCLGGLWKRARSAEDGNMRGWRNFPKGRNMAVSAVLLAAAAAVLPCEAGAGSPWEASGKAAGPGHPAVSESGRFAGTGSGLEDGQSVPLGGSPAGGYESTPVGLHGALRVQGSHLVDAKGENYQLYGMSTHGLSWFPQYVNKEAFQTLRDDWNTNCVRLALYTDEYNGYCGGGNQEEQKKLVDQGVTYAAELGMYAIVDWHVLNDRDPNVHKAEALAFFDEMAERWKDHDNVIYEICNEPNSGTTWDGIKSYANEVIPVIREHDSDAVIIVGTPTWSQDIDQALDSPLEFDNVMYALHFYAGTHTDWLRNRCEECVTKGLPVFISEFGMCDASGSGGNNFDQASRWMELIRQYDLSYCCWNLANKNETSSVIKPDCQKTSGWTESDLSESGQWIRERFRAES